MLEGCPKRLAKVDTMVEVSCRSADVLVRHESCPGATHGMPCSLHDVGDGMQVEMQLLLYEYQHALIMFSLNCQDCHFLAQSPCHGLHENLKLQQTHRHRHRDFAEFVHGVWHPSKTAKSSRAPQREHPLP